MFRRLAEAFQNDGNGTASGSSSSHSQYINNQNQYFNTLPNMILSGTSGLKGFNTAIQSVDAQGTNYKAPAVPFPNNIFIQNSSQTLNKLSATCASSSIDELLAIKNPNATIGCGWIYTPPNQGSPYPAVSQGVIGNADGPLPSEASSYPEYKKYFFDLQLAKKQMLLDKCKALKACTDVDSDVFNGTCGFCTDTNQGVPVDTVGKLLYSGDPLGSCSPQSLVTSSINCPVPAAPVGPQPIVDKTCDPINGRLSAACLYNQVISGGCSDKGSLAIALMGAPSPNDYIANLRNADSVKIYNRVANPPLSLDTFSKGAATVDSVISQVKILAGNTKQPANTVLGAAARDLCLQTGSLQNFDFCSDLPDTTAPPFDVSCLQTIFRKMGGQPAGSAYPGTNSMINYNTMGSLGAVKQYFTKLAQGMSSSDYSTQRDAMIQFLGISPEKLIKRVPYTQGVEVIWFQATPGKPNGIQGILKRTIEKDIVQLPTTNSNNPIPQLATTYPGFTQYSAMIQMFDVRAEADFSNKFNVTVDDGFFIAVNQPANIAKTAFKSYEADQVGLFENLALQGPTTYNSNSCSNYYGATPNITKIFYTDAGGSGHTFQISMSGCNGNPSFKAPYYSLTLEARAPFLNLEVNSDGDLFDDTRNPGLFPNLIGQSELEFHNRPEERNSVPGDKGFVRLTNNSSAINLANIAYQSWGTATFAFRLQSMPVKDAIFSFWVYNRHCVVYLQPINGSSAQVRVQTNMTTNNSISDTATKFSLQLGTWYYMAVAQNPDSLDIMCDSVDNIVKNNNFTTQRVRFTNNGPITTTINNGLYLKGQYSCNIAIGGKTSGLNYYSSAFQFDLAWVHFFDYYVAAGDVVKDCKASWAFTQFPDSLNTYKTV
jgi:hypothetical protein